MEKRTLLKKFNFCKIIIAVLLCLFCSFSLFGCVGRMNLNGGKGSSGGGASGGSSGGSSSGSGSESGGEDDDFGEDTGPSIDDFNDVFVGAIGVYDIDGTENVFYDKHTSTLMSYNQLVNRQFNTIATYLYNTLNRIYGLNSADSSLVINNYGVSKTIPYGSLLSNADQKIISGLSTGNLDNKEYLNYKNSINGGYAFSVVDNGDETYTTSYNEGVLKTENAWKGKDYFTINSIKNALGYIYLNQQNAANANATLSVASDIGLKTYYSTNFLPGSTDITNFDFTTINQLGMTRNFMWNIAYYVAYSIIGDTNIANSINNYNVIFSGSQINSLSSTNYATLPAALEVYKGYNLVVADIVEDLMTLACSSNSSLSIGSSNWENTCFPELKKEMYIYYDKIDDVCDANNDESSDGGDDSGDYSDGGEYDESAMDNIDHGTALKLKKVLLVPYIDTSKINISSFEITGLLIGYQAQDAGTYKVQMSVGGLNKDGGEISPTEVKFSGGDNIDGSKVIYDETYKFSEDLVDVSITMGSQLSNLELSDGSNAKDIIEDSFRKTSRTVDYAGGGSKTIDIGYINVYNNLFNGNGEFNGSKSILELEFNYFNNSNTALTEIPTTYLMYFYIY